MFSSGEGAPTVGVPSMPAKASGSGSTVSTTTEPISSGAFAGYAAITESGNLAANIINGIYASDLLDAQQAAIEQVFEWRNNMVNAQRELGRLAIREGKSLQMAAFQNQQELARIQGHNQVEMSKVYADRDVQLAEIQMYGQAYDYGRPS